MNYCGGENAGTSIYGAPALGENVGTNDFTSGKARGDWEQVVSCFLSIDEKIAGKNERVCVKIHRSFFTVHEIDHPSNFSMNRTVE